MTTSSSSSSSDRLPVRRVAPAAERNRDAILAVLSRVLPPQGTLLEIASGTGQHAMHCAAGLPGWCWQPSDPDADARESIEGWRRETPLANVPSPLDLDVRAESWPGVEALGPIGAIVCINMIHIAPWEAAEALFKQAGARLDGDGILYLYGPYKRLGVHTAPSNSAFDRQLRSTDARWGVRDLERVEALGQAAGLALTEVVPMPANNFSLIFKRAPV